MSEQLEVCRVCLDSYRNKCRSLFDKYKNLDLYEYINNIANLKIKLNDGYPDKICQSCYWQLKSAINFRDKCEASDVLLRRRTVQVEILPVKNITLVKKEHNDFENIDDHEIKVENDSDDNFDCALGSESEQNNFKPEERNEEWFACPVQQINEKIDNHLENRKVLKSRAIDLKLECHDCGGTFKSKCKLKVHWKKTHMLSSLICKNCKRTFKSYKAFHIHLKKKPKSCTVAADKNVSIEGIGRSRVFICRQCNYKSKRVKDMSAHLVIHSGDRPFKCNLCSKKYTQLSSLQGHQETAHQKYMFEITCHYCGKFIRGRCKVNRHLKSHTRVECTVCNKSISKLGFHMHMKRHSGVKSYACEKCASTFYTISELCNHKRIVHSRRKFKCDLCDYRALKDTYVKSHMVKHTKNNIPCTYCGRFFLTAEKLALHQRVHYGEKKFNCPQCTARFYKKDSVRRHLKLKHLSVDVPEKKAKPLKSESVGVSFENDDAGTKKNDVKAEVN